jgi:hypothetical protein
LEFHPEGFNNYLDFGYSVLGQTPVKHVKFLDPSSRLTAHDDGRLEVERLVDPVEKWLGKTLHEDDVLHSLYSAVQEWEQSVTGEIIIPTSCGYDSRLLNALVKDKSRIRSFTYGLSRKQTDAGDVVYAKKLSEILGTRWEHVPLGGYLAYLDEWDKLFGVSTHAHGMYHIEFYKKITAKVKGGNPLLSGIIGDAWAGAVKVPDIASPLDVVNLGYTHSLRADSSKSLLRSNQSMLKGYYSAKKDRLALPLFRLVEAMRFKMILLSYLVTVPKVFGFKPWSPFLVQEIALGMATLPFERRKGRLWQREFFQRHGVDLSKMDLRANWINALDYQTVSKHPVPPLNVDLLREVIQPSYVEWVNRTLRRQVVLSRVWLDRLLFYRKVGFVLRRMGFKSKVLSAYPIYQVLKPIENLLGKRNETK